MKGKQKLIKKVEGDTIITVKETKDEKVVSFDVNTDIKPVKKAPIKRKN